MISKICKSFTISTSIFSQKGNDYFNNFLQINTKTSSRTKKLDPKIEKKVFHANFKKSEV